MGVKRAWNPLVKRDPLTGRALPRDLSGIVCNKLTVIETTGEKHRLGYPIWRARCECGNVIERPSYRFTNKRYKIRDCGCGPLGRPRIPNNGAHINALFGHARQSARVRGIEFALTRQQVRELVARNCYYCGAVPAVRVTHKNLSGEFAWNGIDRVDSANGYTMDNCVPCCARCNYAKSDMPVQQFMEWAARIAAHLPNWS